MTRDELIEKMARAMLTKQLSRMMRVAGLDMDDDFLADWLATQVVPNALTAIEEAGLVVVPRDSTDAMHHAGRAAFATAHDEEANSWEGCEAVWSAMIEASPFVEKKDAD